MSESAFHPEDKARSLIDRRLVACGWLIQIEAKPGGATLSGYSEQAARYIADVPKHLVREEGQVRFEYVASGTETLFRDHADPDPTSRRVYTFHRPETLERELREPLTLRGRL